MIWRWLYSGLTRLVLPVAFGYFAWRGRREPAYRDHWRERLGFLDPVDGPALWVHAASVGEVILVTPLIEALIECYPDHRMVLTTFTPTGRAEAARRLGGRVALCYLPLDTPGATRRFLRRIGPAAGILAETELWPNLVSAAGRAGVPLVLVNASLSARSARRYRRWPVSRAATFMLTRFARIAAADRVHAERFIAAGAPARVVEVTGNLKYDRRQRPHAEAEARELRQTWQAASRPVWLAASTHDSEEAQLLETFALLRARHPKALAVMAPRHPQRFEAVAGLLARAGWQYARRSRRDPVDDRTDIVLVDTIGELEMLYALADVAFVGGSLAPGVGGHNVIEPAAVGCVFTTGPHVAEWRDAMAPMIEAGGAAIARDFCDVADITAGWLEDPDTRQAARQRLAATVAIHRGALGRTVQLLKEVISTSC
ncbi:3-deoxy-D-manno-octulosonic acid transferase [Salinisphaera sp. RV14]|uniref:3-deoxy-D-manno-octulosonic acid transferase n=1 Tax=Salinisphaera sp. RV14 TaxID=3454140 RepID=UPI003F82F85E